MSRRSIPLALIMALSLSGKGHALGLGDIRVDSALNEPLSAQIEILGATAEDLRVLEAKIAARDVFQKFGADRPAFLSSATFKVSIDSDGRPVLKVRSADAFTEPVVSLLIDLNWGHGQLIREFSLLLDPGTPAPADRVVERAVERAVEQTGAASITRPTPTPTVIPPAHRESVVHAAMLASVGAAHRNDIKTSEYRVCAGDTLSAIARRRARYTRADFKRTMDAIFRDNPEAFAGNIDRLRLGSTLKLPAADVQTAPVAPIPTRAPTVEAQDFKKHVRELESELKGVTEQIAARNAAIQDLERRVAESELNPVQQAPPAVSAPQAVAPPPAIAVPPAIAAAPKVTAPPAVTHATAHGRARAVPVLLVMALLITSFFLLRKRKLPTTTPTVAIDPAPEQPVAEVEPSVVAAAETTDAAPVASVAREIPAAIPTPAARTASANDSPSTILEVTAEMTHNPELLERTFEDSIVSDADMLEPDLKTMIMDARRSFPRPVDSTELDYNLNVLDLDSTSQHVEMPSNLSDRAVVSERRTNIADVLKNAIERDPTRRDLLMKLLETYHSEASTNRRAFLDVARKVARQRDSATAEEWNKIRAMGLEIAGDDPLFDESADGADLANCA